jgi:hypothetical protein
MNVDYASELLADDFEVITLETFNVEHVRHERRIGLNRQSRSEIDTEVIMRKE